MASLKDDLPNIYEIYLSFRGKEEVIIFCFGNWIVNLWSELWGRVVFSDDGRLRIEKTPRLLAHMKSYKGSAVFDIDPVIFFKLETWFGMCELNPYMFQACSSPLITCQISELDKSSFLDFIFCIHDVLFIFWCIVKRNF